MITIDEVKALKHGDTVYQIACYTSNHYPASGNTVPCKVRKWRVTGKCKIWKRDINRIQLPVKYGLYDYGYIDNTNLHLFSMVKPNIGDI